MLRNIGTNARLLKERFFNATNHVTRRLSSVANKQGLFGSLVKTNNSESVASNQRKLLSFSVRSYATTRRFSFFVYEETPKEATKASTVPSEALVIQSPHIGFAQVSQVQIPHPEKAQKGGEDACFISKDKSVLAVFDGLSTSARDGIDPRDYATKLAEGGKKTADTTDVRDPKKIMEAGYSEAKVLKGGSSTACVAVLKGNKVHMANLGDSGMFIIRPPNTYLFRSKAQQESFNSPLILPHDVNEAHLEDVKVAESDVVILATDGVFDNIYNHEIIALVEKTVAAHKTADDLAQRVAIAIANQASLAANNQTKTSPFSEAASRLRYGDIQWAGGKLDDITVVVGIVGKVPVDTEKDTAKKSKGRKSKAKNRK